MWLSLYALPRNGGEVIVARIKLSSIVAAAAVLLVSACARGPHTTTIQPLPPQPLESKGTITLISSGQVDGARYTMLTTLRLEPKDGQVAVCGCVQVLGQTDVSARLREGLALDKSALTLTRKADSAKIGMSPRFLPVTYRPPGADGKNAFKLADLEGLRGGCALTTVPWDEKWGNVQYSGALTLYVRDNRQRSQTVVGAAQ